MSRAGFLIDEIDVVETNEATYSERRISRRHYSCRYRLYARRVPSSIARLASSSEA
jgi:hypothetical protein